MDFLKSAVASAISKGPPFPYAFGDKFDDVSVWTLWHGTKREDGSDCSIFSFDVAANKSRLPMARNAVRKLRTLRHPGVVKVLDTVETEAYIYIATERVLPLKWHLRRKSLNEETIKWGLFSIANTLKFINDEASSVHGMICASSIFTSQSGEWRLGGFDVLSSVKDDDAIIYTYGSLTKDSHIYSPPEVASSGWETIKRNPLAAADAYAFGILVFECFNGSFTGGDQLSNVKTIPRGMQPSYRRLINASPKARISVGNFLDQGRRNGGFFETPLIRLTEGIESLGVKNETEREQFLSELDRASDDFPEEFFQMKVLPELLKSMEFGGGGAKVFGVIMKIGAKLSDEYYNNRITPVIVRLFASPDRAVRVCLLDNLPLMIDRLPDKVVNNKIYPQMVTGFTDIAPVVREQTVKAVLTVINKLSDRTVNGELLRHLAKTSNDEQPGIRTNTTICLGKIARNIGPGTRDKVLSAAFVRSLRDPFVHARMAALMALTATSDIFNINDVANRLLPGICPSLIDPEKLIRDQALKTMDVYLLRVRKHASSLPDTALPPTTSTTAPDGTPAPRMSTPSSSDTSWTGWAISSFTNKLATASGDMQCQPPPTHSPTDALGRPSTSPSTARSASASTLHRQALAAPSSSMTKSASSSHIAPAPDSTTNGAEDEADEDFGDAWAEMADDDADFLSSPPDTSATAPTKRNATASNPFDDKGEPDFAGWLSAQQGGAKAKKELPKGLGKKSDGASARPVAAGRSTTTGSLGSGAGAKKAAAAKKVVDITPKVEARDEDADGWADGW